MFNEIYSQVIIYSSVVLFAITKKQQLDVCFINQNTNLLFFDLKKKSLWVLNGIYGMHSPSPDYIHIQETG